MMIIIDDLFRRYGDQRPAGTVIEKSDGYGHSGYGHDGGYGGYGHGGGGCSLDLETLCVLGGLAALAVAGVVLVPSLITLLMGGKRKKRGTTDDVNILTIILEGKIIICCCLIKPWLKYVNTKLCYCSVER